HAMRTLWLGVLVLLAATLLAKLFTAAADLLAAHTTNDIEENFILKTFRHALRLPYSYFTQRPSGSIARQIDQSDQMAPLYAAITQEVWSELFTATAIIIVMLSVNLQLSLVVLGAVLVYLLVTLEMTRHLEAHLEDYYALWDGVSGRIQEVVAGIRTVRTHGNEDYEADRTASIVRNAFRTYLRRRRVETRYSLIQNLLIYGSKGIVLGVGGMRALDHQLTPGDVVMFRVQLYTPQKGNILVDGEDLARADLSRWRKQIAVVSPEGTIFRDTLADNIRYGRTGATDDEVRAAALKAGLGAAVERLPQGLETPRGERGYELSLGERQRVLLARAFLASPKLLILDEATANLDFKTEAAIKK